MDESNSMKNLKSRRLYLQVYDEIKNYIESNHLMPGDKLPSEMKMCEMLGVSRNVLREAIKSLEITGAVRSKPGVGIVIQEFNTDFFLSNLIYSVTDDNQLHKEIEEMRRVLELGFAKDAFDRITEKEIMLLSEKVEVMEHLLSQLKRSHASIYGVKFAEADASFHKILFQNLDNRLLKSIIEFFWACDRYYKIKTTPDNMDLTVEKHQRICTGLKSGHYQEFYDAMQFHFNVGYFKRRT